MEEDKALRLNIDKSWWDEIPKRYKWAAMDKDGRWFVYVSRPWVGIEEWIGTAFKCIDKRPCIYLGSWKDTLSKRPDLGKHHITVELHCGICDQNHLGIWTHKVSN